MYDDTLVLGHDLFHYFLMIFSVKSVFDSVVPILSCKDIFKTQNLAITQYPLAIPS